MSPPFCPLPKKADLYGLHEQIPCSLTSIGIEIIGNTNGRLEGRRRIRSEYFAGSLLSGLNRLAVSLSPKSQLEAPETTFPLILSGLEMEDTLLLDLVVSYSTALLLRPCPHPHTVSLLPKLNMTSASCLNPNRYRW